MNKVGVFPNFKNFSFEEAKRCLQDLDLELVSLRAINLDTIKDLDAIFLEAYSSRPSRELVKIAKLYKIPTIGFVSDLMYSCPKKLKSNILYTDYLCLGSIHHKAIISAPSKEYFDNIMVTGNPILDKYKRFCLEDKGELKSFVAKTVSHSDFFKALGFNKEKPLVTFKGFSFEEEARIADHLKKIKSYSIYFWNEKEEFTAFDLSYYSSVVVFKQDCDDLLFTTLLATPSIVYDSHSRGHICSTFTSKGGISSVVDIEGLKSEIDDKIVFGQNFTQQQVNFYLTRFLPGNFDGLNCTRLKKVFEFVLTGSSKNPTLHKKLFQNFKKNNIELFSPMTIGKFNT